MNSRCESCIHPNAPKVTEREEDEEMMQDGERMTE
jgi:hypothetical protein